MKKEDQEHSDDKARAETPLGAKSKKKSVLTRDTKAPQVLVVAVGAAGTLSLFAASIFVFKPVRHHYEIAVGFIFIAVTAYVLTGYLTWRPTLKRAAKWKQRKIKRVFLAVQLVVTLLCLGLGGWSLTLSPPRPHPSPDVLQDTLDPNNEPDPNGECVPRLVRDFGLSNNFVALYYGTSVAVLTPEVPRFAVLQVENDELLSATRTPDGKILISAKVFSKDGRIVAQLIDNKFFVNPNNYFRIERRDRHALIVYDQYANDVLEVRFLNPKSVQLRGVFYHPVLEAPLVIDRDITYEKTHNTVGGSCTADCTIPGIYFRRRNGPNRPALIKFFTD